MQRRVPVSYMYIFTWILEDFETLGGILLYSKRLNLFWGNIFGTTLFMGNPPKQYSVKIGDVIFLLKSCSKY